ncbi:helix-turn-helix domain-containing protein [Streptomyces sp. NPDC052236]|uniref:helix-turn-helix domain-containing protein n=1 Tax=Streptomyces sp. NPDC052236 TaxID=3365686 RepID=UPI0037D72E79
MDDFGSRVREALSAQGMSMRGAAKALHYDPAYLSRALNGKQSPSAELIQALDELLGTEFAEPVDEPTDTLDGPAYVRSTVAHLLDHDRRYGGDHVADAAMQVWKSEQRKLNSTTDPHKEYLAAVAEIAQVAGWILFDANRQEEARQAFIESQMLARHAGDKSMTWFSMDMLAMQDINSELLGEALRIADELLTQPKIPKRVVLLARVRRARALAQAGDRTRAIAEVGKAKSQLQDSIDERAPHWTWWVDEIEVTGHEAEVLISLGEPAAAIPFLQHTIELLPSPIGRGALYYGVAELTALATAQAWRDAEHTLTRLAPILQNVTSGRSRMRLKGTLRIIERDAPSWLADHAKDITA